MHPSELQKKLETEERPPVVTAACVAVYRIISDHEEGIHEGTISEQAARFSCLGGSQIHHSAYVRTALDTLTDKGLIKRSNGRYFVINSESDST